MLIVRFFFFKQKTAYEMRISDWSSDVCSSDLTDPLDLGFGLIGGIVNAILDAHIAAGSCLDHVPADQRGPIVHFVKQPVHVPDHLAGDRKSVVSGKSVSVRVDLGGRRIIKN